MGQIGRDQFRTAMARFPGAVTVVTARTPEEGERRGITATAVCSVTADPPSVLVCLNRSTGTFATVEATGLFAVNLLSDAQDALALRFAGHGGFSGEAKFAEGDWLTADRACQSCRMPAWPSVAKSATALKLGRIASTLVGSSGWRTVTEPR